MKLQVNNSKTIIANDGPIKAEIEYTDQDEYWVSVGHFGESALILDHNDWVEFAKLVKEINDHTGEGLI